MTNLPDAPDDLMETMSGFLVVGLGASAGGVEALREFFTQVPSNSGIAYVVILHLSPAHESQLATVLQTATPLPVTPVTETVRVAPNHVYVVSPNRHLAMVDGELTVSLNTLPEERRAPVDIFFRTLGETHHNRAVCVVLSGTGADGSMGLKRVKERGGVVFVQSPREAAFNEMPRNAIATDLVDEVLPVAAIPARILAYQASLGTVAIPVEADQRPEEQQQALREIFTQLRVRTGHDFSNYKRPTLLRRIARRINVRNLSDLPAYAAFVRENPDEVQVLLKDLLISVTNFFRDKEAFAAIEQEIIPRVFAGKRATEQVRIWVVGCATGEEAYSIAMLCAERVLGVMDAPSVQIFASDIDEAAIAHAREGLYTVNDTADVSLERLRRFFALEDQRYRIRHELREMVLFANHNVLKDPPFSHLDLVTCRNLLIYLNHTAQERVMETLHFALKPGGYLFLGTSESVDGSNDLFSTISREQHIFQSRATGTRAVPVPEAMPIGRVHPARLALPVPGPDERAREQINYDELQQRLLEQYAPPSLVVNEEHSVIRLSERAGRYLQIAGKALSTNLLQLVRPELRLELRAALYQAVQRQTNVQTGPLPVRIDDRAETVIIHVRPVLRHDDPARGFLLVLFEQGAAASGDTEPIMQADEPLTRQLEDEVQRLKQQLRSSSEQYEYQTEELKATNEELQALNEELRSSTEELETSKEELQSINEELRTVNQELKVKVEEVSLYSTNLQNLVNSTDIGTIFLDRGLRVKLFTPAARTLFNLIPADYGRPLADITHRLLDVDVLADAETVLERLQTIEREARASNGRVYLLRVLPYRAGEDRIGGVVMTFVDISERKRAEEQQAYLLKLSDVLRPISDPVDIQAAVTQVAMQYFNAERCYYCEIEQGNAIIRRDAARGGLPSVAGEYRLSDMPVFKAVVDAGRPFVVHNAHTTDLLDEQLRELCIQLQVISFVDVPVIKDGNPVGILCITQSAPRDWTSFDVELAVETAERTWAAVERARAEVALRVSEERLRLATEAARMYSWEYNVASETYTFSVNAAEILGVAPEALPRTTEDTVALVHPDDRQLVETTLSQAIELGEGFAVDLRSTKQSGETVWLSVQTTAVKDAGGKLLHIVGIAQDITQRKQAEAAQRASEERFRTVTDAVPQVIWANDAAGEAIYFNQRWFEYSGLSYEQSAGPGWQAIVHPDDAPASRERWQRALAVGAQFNTEYRLRRSDGVYRWFIGRNVPLRDESGRVGGWFGTATDIEDLKQAEAARRESEERFRLLVEGARDYAMFLLDSENRITFWSTGAERVFGYSEAEAIGQPGAIIFTREDRAAGAVERQMETAIDQGSALDRRWHIRNDGTRLFLDGALIRLDDEAGKLCGFVKIGRDATAQHEAEEALQRARDELEIRVEERTAELRLAIAALEQEIAERQIVEAQRIALLERIITAQEDERGRVARELHDSLGQFLTGLSLRLSILQEQVESLPAAQASLGEMQRITRRIDQELDRLTMELRPPGLEDLGLEEGLRSYAQEWTTLSGVPIDVLARGLAGIRLPTAVETTAYRIVQEALNNVLKHAEASQVSVLLERRADSLRVIVEDNGVGFDPEALSRKREGGRQVGLIGMTERAALLGGTVSVESAPGSGTTIYIQIPLSQRMSDAPNEGGGKK